MQEAMNISPIWQEHKNNRYAGVLPRDHDHEEQKKSFVGWDQDSSSAKDQGKNNMATERLTEKISMRKPGEDQSLVVKQENSSNNVERDTKPKTVVDNPTGYYPFQSSKRESSTGVDLEGGDINQDDLLSKEKKKGGRSSTPYSDPSKNVMDSVARTSSPLEKEKKAMISSSEPQYSQGENAIFDSRVLRKTSSKEKENKGILSNGTAGQYSDSPKMKAAEEVPSTRIATEKNANVSSTTQNGKEEAAPYLYEAEKNIALPFSSNEARRNKPSTTTGEYGKGEPPKKESCCPCCSIL